MNINDSTFCESVQNKAEELGITPKLLLIAIGAVAGRNGLNETKESIEHTILLEYFKYLGLDMKNAAETQLRSKRESTREAGEVALSKFNMGDLSNYNIKEAELLFFANTINELKYHHVVAAINVIKEVEKLKKKHGYHYLTNLIINLCPKEIEKCNELATLFKNDISQN